jgi:hypothetical protein
VLAKTLLKALLEKRVVVPMAQPYDVLLLWPGE